MRYFIEMAEQIDEPLYNIITRLLRA